MVNTDDSRYDTLPTKTITDALFGTTNPLALIGDQKNKYGDCDPAPVNHFFLKLFRPKSKKSKRSV